MPVFRYFSGRPYLWLLFTYLLAAYPLVALSTRLGYRFIPIALLLVSLVVLAMRRATWTPQLTVWAIALVLLTAPYYLSYFVNAGEAYSMERISYGWLFLAIGAVAARIEPDLKPLFVTLVLGALVTLVAQVLAGGDRPSLYFNPVPFAGLAAGFFCLLCVGLIYTRNTWQFVGVLGGLVLWCAVILLTQTRGAVLAMLPGIVVVLGYCVRRYGRKSSLLAAAALVVVAGGIEMVSGNAMSKRFQLAWNEVQLYQEQPEQFSSIAIRLELYRSALMVANRNPVGLGEARAREQVLEWIEEGKVQPYTRPSMEVAHFHSDWFQQLAVAGYVGVLFQLIFFALLLGYFYRYRDQLPAQLGLVFVASFIISGLTDAPLYNRLPLLSLFMVVTFCLTGLKDKAREHPR